MEKQIVGTRIRQRRKELGIAQAELARRIGVSPSYLNLVEWNRRRATDDLIGKVAEHLGVRVDVLDSPQEKRLRDLLGEIALLPSAAGANVEVARIGELVGRFPGWARALVTFARSDQEAQRRVQSLSDRLANDPYLGEALHGMLTRISSIRSASDILTDYSDLSGDEVGRFNAIIRDETRSLSEIGEALSSYLEKAEEAERILTPIDEVEALFEARANRFEEIEESVRPLVATGAFRSRQQAAELAERHLAPVIDGIVGSGEQVTTASAARRARQALNDYAAAAIMLPEAPFVSAAAAMAYDAEALARHFGTPFDVVCHRLASLPKAAGVPRFGYLRANAAGTILQMLGLPKLVIPRYGSLCPLWVLFRAQQAPETVIRQRALFPPGDRFVFVARARNVGETGFGKPRHFMTDLLALEENDARATVYKPDAAAPLEEIGPGCRICPRRACAHRVEEPLI